MPTEILDFAVGTIIGNISTAVVLTLVYYNFILFEDYFRVIIWAFLFSQALRGAKEKICRLLRYLSRGKEIQRDDKLTNLIMDNGIFIFAWIGGVSIYVRMFSFVSFLQLSVGILFAGSLAVWTLDRRVFYYRLFISDDVLVSLLLILGCFGFFVLFYLGTESYMEGSLAASHVSRWIQTNVVNDERTRAMWTEQIANGKAMVSSAIHRVEGSYNNTIWFGPLKTMVVSYYENPGANQSLQAGTSVFPPNMTWVQAWSFAYAQLSDFNLTSVEVSDMTSKGLEYSGMAVGSVIQLVFVLVAIVVAFVSIGLKSFFFVTSLFYLLSAKWDPVERIVYDLIPIAPEKRPAMVASLRRAIEGVFFLPMKISSLHAIVSLGTDFVFLGTLLSFFISIVPIIPPYLICLPYVCLRLSTSFVPAILLFVVHYFAFTWIDQVLYERSLTSINAYISALSVAFGVYVFGLEVSPRGVVHVDRGWRPLTVHVRQGVVFGPLLVCGVNWAYEISNHGVKAATTDEETSSSPHGLDGQDSIFTSAYKAISGGLRGNLSRGFSFDSSSDHAICFDLEVHRDTPGTPPYVVRYIAKKDWSYEYLVKNMRHTLKVWNVRGLYAKKNHAQILSVEHIFPKELIQVVVQDEPNSPLSHPLPHVEEYSSSSSHRPPMHHLNVKQSGRGAKGGRVLSPSTTPTLVRRRSANTTPHSSNRTHATSNHCLVPRRSFRSSESGSSSTHGDSDGAVDESSSPAVVPSLNRSSTITVDPESDSFDGFHTAASASFRAALKGLRIQSDVSPPADVQDPHNCAMEASLYESAPEEPTLPPPPVDKPVTNPTDDGVTTAPVLAQPPLHSPTSPLYITEKVTTLRQRRGSVTMDSPTAASDRSTKPGLWKSIFKPN
ncbi:hypothetical protein DYB32_001447 [Aphanomyces invadans]|uniref:Transmembrane protein n=1 Tax=Aphanomyces invadans TaxID=157072 RepID=A0A3R6VG83_9STRA|nr:hypothetical protein DYB32_001447 [Aphanomyces invadans]